MSTTPSDPLEARMARLEGSFEQLDKRLGNVETGLHELRTEVRAGFSEMRSEQRTQFFWLLGVIVVGLVLPVVVQLVNP